MTEASESLATRLMLRPGQVRLVAHALARLKRGLEISESAALHHALEFTLEEIAELERLLAGMPPSQRL